MTALKFSFSQTAPGVLRLEEVSKDGTQIPANEAKVVACINNILSKLKEKNALAHDRVASLNNFTVTLTPAENTKNFTLEIANELSSLTIKEIKPQIIEGLLSSALLFELDKFRLWAGQILGLTNKPENLKDMEAEYKQAKQACFKVINDPASSVGTECAQEILQMDKRVREKLDFFSKSTLDEFRHTAEQILGLSVKPENLAAILAAYTKAKESCLRFSESNAGECKLVLGLDIADEIKKTDQLVQTKCIDLEKPIQPQGYYSSLLYYLPTWSSSPVPVVEPVVSKPHGSFLLGEMTQRLEFAKQLDQESTQVVARLQIELTAAKSKLKRQFEEDKQRLETSKVPGHLATKEQKLARLTTDYEKDVNKLEDEMRKEIDRMEAAFDAIQKKFENNKARCQLFCKDEKVIEVLGNSPWENLTALNSKFMQIASGFKTKMNSVRPPEANSWNIKTIQPILTSLIPKLDKTDELYSRPGDKVKINEMLEALKKNPRAIVASDRIEDMAGLVQALLSSLEKPLLKEEKKAFSQAGSVLMAERQAEVLKVVHQLPVDRKALLKTIVMHLHKIANSPNQLDTHDLAERFVPVLFGTNDHFEEKGNLLTKIDPLSQHQLTMSLAHLIENPDLLNA